jgi:hypothetical protein
MPDMEQLKALLDAYQQTGSRRLGPVPEDLQVRIHISWHPCNASCQQCTQQRPQMQQGLLLAG